MRLAIPNIVENGISEPKKRVVSILPELSQELQWSQSQPNVPLFEPKPIRNLLRHSNLSRSPGTQESTKSSDSQAKTDKNSANQQKSII